jgi:hypothetical protein
VTGEKSLPFFLSFFFLYRVKWDNRIIFRIFQQKKGKAAKKTRGAANFFQMPKDKLLTPQDKIEKPRIILNCRRVNCSVRRIIWKSRTAFPFYSAAAVIFLRRK